MPITIHLNNQPTGEWKSSRVESADQGLASITQATPAKTVANLLQTSLSKQSLQRQHISSSPNGFVWAAIHAYSSHFHLTIRPDDVWLAILTQISHYINGNAEEVRHFFVAHDGQKELIIDDVGDIGSVDFAILAKRLANLVTDDVKDPTFHDWAMPAFSTTTDNDLAVASVVLMGSMQKYYAYELRLSCGIPSLTLDGNVADWQSLLEKLEKLAQFGAEPRQFASMLRPILENMIMSFEKPTSSSVLEFWNSIADQRHMSGSTTYTGWITAFCFWDNAGVARKRVTQLAVCKDELYPAVESCDVPAAFSSVPVKVNDNGTLYSCTMTAGLVGIEAHSSSANQESQAEGGASYSQKLDRIQPVSAWWICSRGDESEAEVNDTGVEEITPNGAFNTETIKALTATKEYKDMEDDFQSYMAQFEN